MSDHVDEADELPLVCRHCPVSRGDGPAKEGNGVALLDQHCTEAMGGGVAFHHVDLGEFWHG
jgi:hypothetical protein